MGHRFKLVLCVVVAAGWALNLVAGTIPPLHYHPDPVVDGPMTLVIGAVLATRRGKDSDGE